MLLLLIPILWLALGIVLVSQFSKRLKNKSWIIKAVILSMLYSFFFGIGIIGMSNAEPGFALPCPIFLSWIIDLFNGNEIEFIFRGTVIPFGLWWAISFTILGIFKIISKFKARKSGTSTGPNLN